MLRTLAASARPLLRTGLRFGSSAWANVPLGPPDPILGLTLAFQADQNPQKVNLGVGAYRDDNNKPFIVEAVSKAEKKLHGLDMEYAPIAGVPAFTQEAAKLTFGSNSKSLKDNRVSSIQTLSGTGALRVMGDFLQRFYPGPKKIFLPDPTWANHTPIFKDAGLEVGSYRYYRADDCGFNYEGMLEDLKKIPDNSIVLLHACAHNPTGVDPTPEQWKGILEVMKEKNHYPAIDSAYQGFASGDPTKDAVAVRLFDEAGLGMMVCQSFAKNFGLYGHRVGALHTVCRDADEKNRVDSQLKILVRPMYSNPPIHGARIVAAVLNDQELTQVWERDVRAMADRIKSMRQKLVDELKKAGSSKDWSHILKQIGMFSYTGLNKEQCEKLIKEHHIYLTANGRISMAGITSKNVTYVAQAIHAVTK